MPGNGNQQTEAVYLEAEIRRMGVRGLRRLKQLEEENRKLKRLVLI